MRRNIVLAIATVLLVATASAASAAQVPNKQQGGTYTTQKIKTSGNHQERFHVGY